MTIREYISQKLQAFNLSEAFFADIAHSLGMSPDDEYSYAIEVEIGKAMATALAEIILAPRLSNVSESGFSMSWDYSELGKYYKYLCTKYGVPINEDALSVAELSVIIDKTNIW